MQTVPMPIVSTSIGQHRVWPSISIVMPMRNEETYVERSLQAMLAQDYDGRIEILCVDGMSDDRTRQIVLDTAQQDSRVRLLDNPKRITPAALNIGIQNAKYEFIARMDAHSVAPPDYLTRCVETFQKYDAECVGGGWEYQGTTFISKVIAVAMDSRFGPGPAPWRGAREAREADTVPFGLWRRERMLELGGFDECLIRNQDYEFNYRLRASGGKVIYSPDIKTTYYVRRDLKSLWRQYYQYGLWKARVLKMHPESFRLRHGVAPLFVSGLILGAILSLFGRLWRSLYILSISLYLLLSVLFSVKQASRHGWHYLPLLPIIFAVLHLAWGSGFLVGVWKSWTPSPQLMAGE